MSRPDLTFRLTAFGWVKCWGLNDPGGKEDVTTDISSMPVVTANLDSQLVALSNKAPLLVISQACGISPE